MRTLALTLAVVGAGCVHPLMLKKFSATAPKVAGIEGHTVRVEPFVDQRVSDWDDKKSVPLPDPKGFAYQELTSEQMAAWKAERDALEEKVPREQWYKIGFKRNGFGVPIIDVHSVNAPAPWLTEATRVELQAQGAQLVDSGDPDLVVQAVLRYAWLDMYVATWVHLVLDVTTTLRGQAPVTVRVHASEGKTAWTGSEVESFEIYTATEQKLERYLVDLVGRQLRSPAGSPPPTL